MTQKPGSANINDVSGIDIYIHNTVVGTKLLHTRTTREELNREPSVVEPVASHQSAAAAHRPTLFAQQNPLGYRQKKARIAEEAETR